MQVGGRKMKHGRGRRPWEEGRGMKRTKEGRGKRDEVQKIEAVV